MKARIIEENNPVWYEKYLFRKQHIPFLMEYIDEDGSSQQQLVSVSQAPEPTDIIWKNLHNTTGELRKRSYMGI